MDWLVHLLFLVILTIQVCQNHHEHGNRKPPNNVSEDVFYYATYPQPSNVHCNAQNVNLTVSQYNFNLETGSFWYPARRNVHYGPYEYILWGEQYGRKIKNKQIKTTNIKSLLSYNCLVENTSNSTYLLPQNCNSYHKLKCVAPRSQAVQSIKIISSEELSKSLYNVNDATESFQNLLVSNDMRVLCPSCFRSTKCSNVDMVLSFNDKKRTLYLAIYSPECLYNYKDPKYIYCFTDASDDLKKRVDLNIYYNHTMKQWNESSSIIYKVRLEKYVGDYWCEAYSLNDNTEIKHVSNIVTAYSIKTGNEFAVKLRINDVCQHINCENTEDISKNLRNFIIEVIEDLSRNTFAKIRLMRIFSFDTSAAAEILIHFSFFSSHPPLDDIVKLRKVLKSLPEYIDVIYVKSSECCLAESHKNLTWPLGLPYQQVLPEELCMQSNFLPVSRMCVGDFLNGFDWSETSGTCSDSDLTEETKLLHSFSIQDMITEDVVNNVSMIVEHGNLSVTDLFFVSQILDKFSDNATLNTSLFDASLNVINGLLKANSSLLAQAQEQFNLTDSFLRIIEYVATNLTEHYGDVLTIHKKQVLVHTFNPVSENVSGFVLFQNSSFCNINNFDDIVDLDQVELALYVPDKDIQSIVSSNLTNVSVVAIVYLTDTFFPSNNMTGSSPRLVMNLNIPNYDTYLRSRIPLLVRTDSVTSNDHLCAFWDYGDQAQPKKGSWSSLGGEYGGEFESNSLLKLCSYSHLTHLALLVADRSSDFSLDQPITDKVLSYITAVGSLLSCAGIIGIFITAFAFRSWRNRTGTQILLNLSIAILLEIVFMYINGTVKVHCTLPGFILHYVVLCKFAWMLVYAFCQYLRFVRVFGPMPKNLLLKSMVFGWGVGLIPSLTVLLADSQTYNIQDNFCYPTGLCLYLGVYLPVIVILLINLGVFCKILKEVTKAHFDQFRIKKNRVQHFKLAVLLSSVLGIPWVTGLLFNIFPEGIIKTVFIYIFTVSAGVQGFVMFLFYVAFNPETRSFWNRTLLNKTTTISKNSMSVSIIS